jgi:hypothetical protein
MMYAAGAWSQYAVEVSTQLVLVPGRLAFAGCDNEH